MPWTPGRRISLRAASSAETGRPLVERKDTLLRLFPPPDHSQVAVHAGSRREVFLRLRVPCEASSDACEAEMAVPFERAHAKGRGDGQRLAQPSLRVREVDRTAATFRVVQREQPAEGQRLRLAPSGPGGSRVRETVDSQTPRDIDPARQEWSQPCDRGRTRVLPHLQALRLVDQRVGLGDPAGRGVGNWVGLTDKPRRTTTLKKASGP